MRPKQPVATWIGCAVAPDPIGLNAVVALPDLMADPWVREHGLSVTQCSEEVGEVTYPGTSPRLSETPVRLGQAVRQFEIFTSALESGS